MLTRWARSNVRESLVMFNYVFKGFRKPGEGANWIRLFTITQTIRITLFEALKCALLVALVMHTFNTLLGVVIACVFAAIIPSLVYFLRHRTSFGFLWVLPYTLYWMFFLSWISLWGILTAANSGWLTRDLPKKKKLRTPIFSGIPNIVTRRLKRA